MRLSVIFLVFFVCLVASQDLEIPRDLLEPSNLVKIDDGGLVADPQRQSATSPQIGGRFIIRRPSINDDSDFVPRCARQEVRSSRLLSSLSECDIVAPLIDYVEVTDPVPLGPRIFITDPEVDVDRICPIGQIQSGFGCVSQYECPPGHERRNGRCVRVFVECPTGFHREGSRCVEEVQCPRNYEKQGNRCVLLRPDCSPGYYWNGQQCLIEKIECESGFVYSNGQCIREIVTCLPDEIDIGGECRPKEVKCPEGYSRTETGFCERRTQRCQNGFQWNGSACIRKDPVIEPPRPRPRTTTPPPDQLRQRCPEGYQLYQGQCYRCRDIPEPERPVCQTTNDCCGSQQSCCGYSGHQASPNININVHNHGSGRASSGQGYNIVNNVHPAENKIHNINNVTAPVSISNINENVISIHHGGQCRDGTIKTTVIRNNVTEHSCTDAVQESGEEVTEVHHPKKCCEVATPRKCQQTNGNWGCGHRRYKYCGDFCTSKRVYLRPNENTFDGSVLMFAPVQNPYAIQSPFGHGGGYMDCSGCQNGSFNCSPQCFTYPCQRGGGCTYMDQQDFCGTVGGNVCN